MKKVFALAAVLGLMAGLAPITAHAKGGAGAGAGPAGAVHFLRANPVWLKGHPGPKVKYCYHPKRESWSPVPVSASCN